MMVFVCMAKFFFHPMIIVHLTPPKAHLNNIHQTACPGFHRTTSWLKTTSWFRMFSFKRSRDAGIFEVVKPDCRMVEGTVGSGTVAYDLRVSFINRCVWFGNTMLSHVAVHPLILCVYIYILSIGYLLWCFVFLFSLLVKFIGKMFIFSFNWLIDWLIDRLVESIQNCFMNWIGFGSVDLGCLETRAVGIALSQPVPARFNPMGLIKFESSGGFHELKPNITWKVSNDSSGMWWV